MGGNLCSLWGDEGEYGEEYYASLEKLYTGSSRGLVVWDGLRQLLLRV